MNSAASSFEFIRTFFNNKKTPKPTQPKPQDLSKARCSVCGKCLDNKAIKKYEKLAKKRASTCNRTNTCHHHYHCGRQRSTSHDERCCQSNDSRTSNADDSGYASVVTKYKNRRQENARLQKMRVDISLTSLPEPSLNNSTAMVYSPVIVPRVHLSAASQPIDIIKYKQAMEVDITKLEYPIQVAPIPLRFSNRNAPIPSATSVDVPPNREILPRAGIRVGH